MATSKPGPKRDPQHVAQVVVDASIMGDAAAAERHKISEMTVNRYRHLAEDDASVKELVSAKWAAADKDWSVGLSSAIKAQIEFLNRAAASASPIDADVIDAVTGALKTLADVALTSRMLDARIANRTGQAREADGPADGSNGEEPEGAGEVQ